MEKVMKRKRQARQHTGKPKHRKTDRDQVTSKEMQEYLDHLQDQEPDQVQDYIS